MSAPFVLTKVCQWPEPVILEELQMMDDLLCICTFPFHLSTLHLLDLFDPTDHNCYKRRQWILCVVISTKIPTICDGQSDTNFLSQWRHNHFCSVSSSNSNC